MLGPILFLIFINDMECVAGSSTVRFFSDDNRISRQIDCCTDHDRLQQDLSNVLLWSKENSMLLHEEKFELLIHKANTCAEVFELPYASVYQSYEVSDNRYL